MELITFLEVKQKRQQILIYNDFKVLHWIAYLSKTQAVTLAFIVQDKCKVWRDWLFAQFPKPGREDTH